LTPRRKRRSLRTMSRLAPGGEPHRLPDVHVAAAAAAARHGWRLDRRAALAAVALPFLARRAASAAAWDAGAREAMVATVEDHARHAGGALEGRAGIDPRVLAVMLRVPRHAFVPAEQAARAYEDRPLPIGHGQTISQPFVVALMTDLLRPAPGHVVLEVGTGSGYQAAVLAELVRRVHTVEIIPPLADQAERRLRALGYRDVAVHRGDGYHGLPEAAPFDGIVVTAAAAGGIPPPLLDQLRPGGRMAIPVGGGFALQHLVLVDKAPDGKVRTRQTLPVAFVPLVRGGG
jgi:protein-L-isoaspartate(D-aspartate) O-methyltransferase